MLRLRRVAPPALDQRVVEHRFVAVLTRDYDDLVPDARIDDPLAVHLSPKVFLVDPGKRVAGTIHTSPPVAPTDDCNELACLFVVVSCDELGYRPLREPLLRKATTYFRSRPDLFLRIVSPRPM
jgi:hypothetical protein